MNKNKNIENKNQRMYNPAYHFKPNKEWMNDPNGLIYINGYYHMFFQHDKIDHVFKDMSWGHAVTKDFIHWEELDVAIKPDELGVIYSGSTIIDRHNHSGLGKDSILAFYTSTLPRQQQSLAYSLDHGKTFLKYRENPIIENNPLSNIPDDFRDPKVIWHDGTKKWIMLIAAFNRIHFWTSRNLIHWNREYEFYDEMDKKIGVFECPDLFQLPINGDHQNGNKWVLLLSSNMGGINGETCTRYYTGDLQVDAYEKISFARDDQPFKILDFGRDNYASITWSNVLDRTLLIGWMNNWEYAFQTPTKEWKGMMTLPRELSIWSYSEGIKLISKPVAEIEARFNIPIVEEQILCSQKEAYVGEQLMCSKVEVLLERHNALETGIELYNEQGEYVRIGYHAIDACFYVDRRMSENVFIHKGFKGIHTTPNVGIRNKVQMTIYIDRTSVEVFFENGEYVMSDLVFPLSPYTNINLYGDDEMNVAKANIMTLDMTL
ncbi:MAG: glycoside hydrolase family 32 protein [Vallitaleaceae bacterium]|nr:glycoside hydrolase family 32 protein [Vallitaleaceae bacterium]